MKPLERILLSVTILLGAQSFPLAAQWVNGPEYNPSQKHAMADKEPYVKMQTTAVIMGLTGLAVVPVGVYLFVYDACSTPVGQNFHPLEGKACAGLVCFTAGWALIAGCYVLYHRGESGEHIIRRLQDPYRLPYSMLTIGPTEHGLGMSYRF